MLMVDVYRENHRWRAIQDHEWRQPTNSEWNEAVGNEPCQIETNHSRSRLMMMMMMIGDLTDWPQVIVVSLALLHYYTEKDTKVSTVGRPTWCCWQARCCTHIILVIVVNPNSIVEREKICFVLYSCFEVDRR